LIGLLISTIGVIRYKKKSVSLSLLSKLSFAFTLFRSLISLLSSWNFTRVNGYTNGLQYGLQYPSLSFFVTATLLPIWNSLYDWEKRRLNIEEEYELEEIVNTNEESLHTSTRREKLLNFFTLNKKSFNFWRRTITFLTLFSAIWQFVSLSGSRGRVVTQCSKNLNNVGVGESPTTPTNTIQRIPQGEVYKCSIESDSVSSIEIIINVIALLIVLSPLFKDCLKFSYKHCCGFLFEDEESNERTENRENDYEEAVVTTLMKGQLIGISLVVLTAVFLIATAIIQAKGISTSGLESCDINYSLLSSNSGYLAEWWASKLNTVRHIALL